MKTAWKIFAVLAAAALMFACQPQTGKKIYTVKNIPNVRLTDRYASVSNPDSTLSSATVADINRKLFDLQGQTSIQVAVVVISTIGDAPVEDFANRLFRDWEIGQKGVNNGLLILAITDDRLVRFEVGYGLEGVLTDALSKRIQITRMMPYLRENDWDGAMITAVDSVIELFTNPDSELLRDTGTETDAESAEGESIIGLILFLFAGLAAILGLAMLAQRRANKCPKCGAQMKVVSSDTVRVAGGKTVTTITLKCPKCGYTTTRETTNNPGGGSVIGGGMIGGMMGGMMGGFGGGRGGGGGSWGGGSSGGGGATTRF